MIVRYIPADPAGNLTAITEQDQLHAQEETSPSGPI